MSDEIPAPAPEPSAASSAGSSTSDPFAGDPGPGFDPGSVREPAPDPGAAPGHWPEVEEHKVRDVLRTGGDMLHAAAGVGEHDLRMTQADLDRIAPPLTRILNRYEAIAGVAAYSDELALVGGVGLWGWRSILERQAVLAARRDGTEAPASAPAGAAEPAAAASNTAPVAEVQQVEVVPGYQTLADQLAGAGPEQPA